MTATCIWCGKTADGKQGGIGPQNYAKNGMLYIHQACLSELSNLPDEVNHVYQILTEGKDKYGNDDALEFIQRMQRFKRRWEGSMKLVASLTKEPSAINYGSLQEKTG